MTKQYIVCDAKHSGGVEVVGSYDDSGEAARACNSGGAGFHVVRDGAVVRYHGRTPRRVVDAMALLLRSGNHPAQKCDPNSGDAAADARRSAPSAPSQAPATTDADADADDPDSRVDASSVGTMDSGDPDLHGDEDASDDARDGEAEGTDRVTSHPVGRRPKVITVRGISLTLDEWAQRFNLKFSSLCAMRIKHKRTWEEEIEFRLSMRENPDQKTKPRPHQDLSHKDKNKRADVRGPSAPASKDTSRAAGDASADGTLADLQEILRAATLHGGIRKLIDNANFGKAIREIQASLDSRTARKRA